MSFRRCKGTAKSSFPQYPLHGIFIYQTFGIRHFFRSPFRLVGEGARVIFVETMGRKFRPINIHRVGFLVDVGLSPAASPQPLS